MPASISANPGRQICPTTAVSGSRVPPSTGAGESGSTTASATTGSSVAVHATAAKPSAR